MTVYEKERVRTIPTMHAPYTVGEYIGEVYFGKRGTVAVNPTSMKIRVNYTTLEGENKKAVLRFYPNERKAFFEALKRYNLPAKGVCNPIFG